MRLNKGEKVYDFGVETSRAWKCTGLYVRKGIKTKCRQRVGGVFGGGRLMEGGMRW